MSDTPRPTPHPYHIEELAHLVDLLRVAIEELDRTIAKMSSDWPRSMSVAWHHLNGILIYAARISRVLWASAGPSGGRGESLRELLNVPENSIFHYQYRNVRNDFDHIDERLDDIEAGRLRLGNLDRNIGGIHDMIGNKGPGDYARHYDPRDRRIWFGASNISLPELLEEVDALERSLATLRLR